MLVDIGVYFTHAAAAVFGLLILLWAVSLAAKDASLIDIFWGFGFLVVAAVCLYLSPQPTPYHWLLCGLPILWGARLTLYLGRRNLGHGEDKRYVRMRRRAENKGMSERVWRLRTLLTVFFGQGVLIMIVSAPIWIAMATGPSTELISAPPENYEAGNTAYSTHWNVLPLPGAALWLIGFLFEAIGDAQLASFLKKNKGYNGLDDDKPVMDKGLWKYTRHPNYFGNACMWWGIWLIACQAPWGWASVFGPIIMTILLTKVSGRDLLERDLGRRKNYQDYIRRTSGFFPRPPTP